MNPIYEAIREKIKRQSLSLGIRVDEISTKIGKPIYKPNFNDSKELNMIYKKLSDLPDDLAKTLSDAVPDEDVEDGHHERYKAGWVAFKNQLLKNLKGKK